MEKSKLSPFFCFLSLYLDSESLMITWKATPLQNPNTFNQSDIIKTIPIQNFLLFFTKKITDSQYGVSIFDFEGKRGMETQWKGPSLSIEKHSSICQYGNNSLVILTTTDDRGTQLSILTFNLGENGVIIDHNLISLKEKLLKSFHSANIFGHRMYIYGGKDAGKVSNELCFIDLKTFAVARNCFYSGQKPGDIWGHKSVSIKNKIYIYGGYINGGLASKMSVKSSEIPNENVYALDIGKMKWEKLQGCSGIYGAAQVYEDNIFFFGGTEEIDHNYLSVFDTSKNLWYQVSANGDVPKPGNNFISAVYGKEMMIFDDNETQGKDSSLISYSFNVENMDKEIKKRQEISSEASKKSKNGSENLEKQETSWTTLVFFIFSFFEAFKKSNERLKESGSDSSLLRKITSGLKFWLEEMIGSWFNKKFPGFYSCRKRTKKLIKGEYFSEIPTKIGDWMQSCIRRKINFWANSALSSAQDSMKEMDPEVTLDIMIVLRGYMNQIVDFVVEFILSIPGKLLNLMKILVKEALFSCCRKKNQKRRKRE